MNNWSFELGTVTITRGVADKMKKEDGFANHVRLALGQYISDDWGSTCPEDQKSNNYAVGHGERILAVYENPEHPDWRIWIITEWDRSATTILFPEEY